MDKELIEAAIGAMQNAYAPYSLFSVGAAVRADNGRIYAGCNVENAAYPLGNCAETSAIAAMVMGGVTRITAVAVAEVLAIVSEDPCTVVQADLVGWIITPHVG